MPYAKNAGNLHNLKVNGVTLIEAMVVLAIIAIVASMAIPTFSTAIARNRIASYTNEFLSFLSFARNEAILHGREVILCKSEDGTFCSTNDFGWEQGWVVFVDVNKDKQFNAGEELRVHSKIDGNITLKGSDEAKDYVRYSSDGRTRTITGESFNIDRTLSICDNSGSGIKNAIKISKLGRVSSDRNCKTCPSPYAPCTECSAVCP